MNKAATETRSAVVPVSARILREIPAMSALCRADHNIGTAQKLMTQDHPRQVEDGRSFESDDLDRHVGQSIQLAQQHIAFDHRAHVFGSS